jgi:hypothetical protein
MPGVAGRSGGHNRKTAAEHVVGGTHRADRHGAALALVPAGAPPDVPGRDHDEREKRHLLAGLSRASRALGRKLLAEYEGWGPAELASVRLALQALDRAEECRRRIADDGGLVLKGKRGAMKPHPLLRAERSWSAFAAATLRALNLGAAK